MLLDDGVTPERCQKPLPKRHLQSYLLIDRVTASNNRTYLLHIRAQSTVH